MQSKLLIIEDDVSIAEPIMKGLNSAGYAVVLVSDGNTGYEMAKKNSFDAIILDIMLPGIDGFEIIQKLRKDYIETPILVLSAKNSVNDRVKGLQTGGDDYLTKPFEFVELLARIQALLRRSNNDKVEITTLKIENLTVDLITRKVSRDGKDIELRPKEYDLLVYLLKNKGRIVSKNMIIENVWDFNFDPMTNVVESKICLLREKIDRDFKMKLVHTIRGVGYVIEEK